MTTDTTSFSSLDRVLADLTLWKKELRNTPNDQIPSQVRDQLLHNVAPFMEQLIQGIGGELTEMGAEMINQGDAIQNIIDMDEGFLTPEMANDLKATLALGMAVVGILESEEVKLENDLKDKQLQDAMKLYKTQTTILLGQIDEITQEDEDDDDNNDGDDSDIIHGQGENSGSTGDGGAGAGDDGAGVGAGGADAGTGDGTEGGAA